MAIFSSFAVKLGVGVASTLALVTGVYYGAPKLLQSFLNEFFNEVELEILRGESQDWSVDSSESTTGGTSSKKIIVKASNTATKVDSSVTYTWECSITVKGDAVKDNQDKSKKLVESLKKWLNQDKDKQGNRAKLILACSEERENTTDPNSVKANLDLDLSDDAETFSLE